MHTTETITREVIAFLRKYGHLDDPARPPDFCGEEIPGNSPAFAQREPWRRNEAHLYQPSVSGREVYSADFKRFEMPELYNSEFEKLPLKDIPDSRGCVLIDIGSELGRWNTRPFALERPNVKVFMVDKLTKAQLNDATHFEEEMGDVAGVPFYIPVPISDDIEVSVNKLLQENGYANITYLHKWLTYDDLRLGIEERIKGRRIFVTGFRNPEGIGNLTVMKAIELGAEGVYVNNPWVERNHPDSLQWDLMRAFLSSYLSPSEIEKIIHLAYDPEDTRPHEKTSCKYKYDEPGQREFGYTLKLLFALAQRDLLEKHGYAVNLFSDRYPLGYGNYSAPNQNLVARKLRH